MSNNQTSLKNWFLKVPKGTLFWKIMGGIMIYACFVLWFDDHYFPKQKFLETEGVTITSVVLGLLLVFRTNSAYDRWWEGRKLWGQLVNDIRNLCLKSRNYIINSSEENEKLARLLIAFPCALRDHLRAPKSQAEHRPLYIADQIYATINDWKKETNADSFQQLLLDPHLRSLMDICGSCERILKSPISGTYKEMIWLGLGLYLLALPWLLVPSLEIWSLPVMLIGSYFVVTLELLAEEVEEPFGTDHNDLPLDTICKNIESSVHQILHLPDELQLTV